MSKAKTYLLFAGQRCYPEGGARDFKMRGTLEECKAWFEDPAHRIGALDFVDETWANIADSETLQIVLTGKGIKFGYHGGSTSDQPRPGPVEWAEPGASFLSYLEQKKGRV